jgi:CDP-paratose 2-epimerase
MSLYIVTGSSGLVGSAVVRHYCEQGADVIGIDNNQRAEFFGPAASTAANGQALVERFANFQPISCDIRDAGALEPVFSKNKGSIAGVIHTAGQPSHDWAARAPEVDFAINATATLSLLELVRSHCPDAPFAFTSTNKVYGDSVNSQAYDELPTRWEIVASHPWHDDGVPEDASIDATKHSVFGVSKAAADLMVQEYGRYFGIPTACFRCGCITGAQHSGAKLHGFLAYLANCAINDESYTIIGHGGKQVRDNLHAADLASACAAFIEQPRVGEVYNMGGGRRANVSVLEAIAKFEQLTGRPIRYSIDETMRSGDHIWWISDLSKFHAHYPEWTPKYDIDAIFEDLIRLDGR